MEPKTFNFWQDHSLHYLEMALRNDRRGDIAHPDGYGKRTGQCGDTIEMYLSIHQGRIELITFQADGCMNTNACANTVAEMAEGRKVEDAWEIGVEDVIAYLETLPPQNHHCAELAVGSLYLALSNYQEHKRQPWKKLYSGK